MDIVEAIRARKSIRAYRKDPVSVEVIEEILNIAIRAPSGSNIQPWNITVATGEKLDAIRDGNLEMYSAGNIPAGRRLEGKYRERQMALGIQLFSLIDIDRQDREKREDWVEKGLKFFDAPAAIFISAENTLSDASAYFDCGLLTQAICLTALNYGLGTCIMGQGIAFPDVVRRHTGIPESEKLIISIALGYPDWDFPANKLESAREPLETIARFVE